MTNSEMGSAIVKTKRGKAGSELVMIALVVFVVAGKGVRYVSGLIWLQRWSFTGNSYCS